MESALGRRFLGRCFLGRRLILVRELKNHDEVHDDDVCWLAKDWNDNVSFGSKKET